MLDKGNGPVGTVANTNHLDSKALKSIYIHCLKQSFQAHSGLENLVFYSIQRDQKLKGFGCTSHIHLSWLEYYKGNT
jgi:hypothetical protein